MQRYQTEDEHRKAMRAKINKTIKRGRRRKRIIRRLNKAVPGICIGVLIAGMGAWCIAAPLPDPDDYEPYRFQAENGQWYTQEEYEQMSRERDAYHQQKREEAEKEAQMIRDYQEQYQNLCIALLCSASCVLIRWLSSHIIRSASYSWSFSNSPSLQVDS